MNTLLIFAILFFTCLSSRIVMADSYYTINLSDSVKNYSGEALTKGESFDDETLCTDKPLGLVFESKLGDRFALSNGCVTTGFSSPNITSNALFIDKKPTKSYNHQELKLKNGTMLVHNKHYFDGRKVTLNVSTDDVLIISSGIYELTHEDKVTTVRSVSSFLDVTLDNNADSISIDAGQQIIIRPDKSFEISHIASDKKLSLLSDIKKL